jgi:hypothetical protein
MAQTKRELQEELMELDGKLRGTELTEEERKKLLERRKELISLINRM